MSKPFTPEHFDESMRSFKDDMINVYIDEAVKIYCNLKGITLGPRPASSMNYSQSYSDAFEVANYAVFLASQKMGSYNSQKGAFKPYLDTVLCNELKDILKEDGKSDFFDSTSKKKYKDDEPERHGRVDIDLYYGAGGHASEPDNEFFDAEERVRKFKDDWLETLIKFIEGLSKKDQHIIYSSSFGNILRPDLKGYRRDYAEVLAGIYNTTAGNIRQIVNKRMKEARKIASSQGFNAQSLSDMRIGMIVAKVNTPLSPDKNVLKAIDKLNLYQQFLLLRYVANMEK